MSKLIKIIIISALSLVMISCSLPSEELKIENSSIDIVESGLEQLESFTGEFRSERRIIDYRTVKVLSENKVSNAEFLQDITYQGKVAENGNYVMRFEVYGCNGLDESTLEFIRKHDVIKYNGKKYYLVTENEGQKKYVNDTIVDNAQIQQLDQVITSLKTFLNREDLTVDFLEYNTELEQYSLQIDASDYEIDLSEGNSEMNISSNSMTFVFNEKYQVIEVVFKYTANTTTLATENIEIADKFINHIVINYEYSIPEIDFDQYLKIFDKIS